MSHPSPSPTAAPWRTTWHTVADEPLMLVRCPGAPCPPQPRTLDPVQLDAWYARRLGFASWEHARAIPLADGVEVEFGVRLTIRVHGAEWLISAPTPGRLPAPPWAGRDRGTCLLALSFTPPGDILDRALYDLARALRCGEAVIGRVRVAARQATGHHR